jgi:lipoate-protein ligase A
MHALLTGQDLGNTNFSIILPRLLFTRAHGAELVARAIRDRLGIDTCGVNKRNDVVIRDGDAEFKASEPGLLRSDPIGLT